MKVKIRKEYYQHQRRHYFKQQRQQQHYGNKYFGKNYLKQMHWLMLMEMILQKEKDLELAAKIGQSLLEQNHELQTRYFYLLITFLPLFFFFFSL